MKYLASSVLALFSLAQLSNCATLGSSTSVSQATCKSISKTLSSASEVYYPLSAQYLAGIEHWMSSASQNSKCVIEVGSTADMAKLMKTIAKERYQFAVVSGGHASNQGFSSTKGLQISLKRLNAIELSSDNSTVKVGLGNLWSDVYDKLQGTGYNVVGGRVPGPGTGGFTLGGGYSWLTNQYGLTCDTVKSFNLVLPNGTAVLVDESVPDLFFALKGGLNRFGIVTEIEYKAVTQSEEIYGGYAVYLSHAVPALLSAVYKFEKENTDPKAQVILTLNDALNGVGALLLYLYDGPENPQAFKPFEKIKALDSNLKKQTFADFEKSVPANIAAGQRGAFATLATSGFTMNYLNAIYNETKHYGDLAVLHGGTFISYDIEPFKDYGQHATDSAFPHANSPLPLNLYFAWKLAENDAYWHEKMKQSVAYLTEVAKKEGIYSDDIYAYPNYALQSYTAEQLYGSQNAARLRKIKAKYDPHGVMELTGGFKL